VSCYMPSPFHHPRISLSRYYFAKNVTVPTLAVFLTLSSKYSTTFTVITTLLLLSKQFLCFRHLNFKCEVCRAIVGVILTGQVAWDTPRDRKQAPSVPANHSARQSCQTVCGEGYEWPDTTHSGWSENQRKRFEDRALPAGLTKKKNLPPKVKSRLE
jgi:hypothetical protein